MFAARPKVEIAAHDATTVDLDDVTGVLANIAREEAEEARIGAHPHGDDEERKSEPRERTPSSSGKRPAARRGSASLSDVDLGVRQSEASPLLQWRGLSVEFGDCRAVDRVSGSLRRGQFLAILGPSGSGKSTLLDVLTGRLKPTCGTLLALGAPHSARAFRAAASFVPQDDVFLPHLRTREALYFVARLRIPQESDARVAATCESLLGTLGLGDKAQVYVGGTSSAGSLEAAKVSPLKAPSLQSPRGVPTTLERVFIWRAPEVYPRVSLESLSPRSRDALVSLLGRSRRMDASFSTRAIASSTLEEVDFGKRHVFRPLALPRLSGGVTIRGLSGGQRRRLSFATGLVSEPRAFVIDEPTSGLDAAATLKLMGLLRRFAYETKMGVLITIHQPRTAVWAMLDEVYFLSGGALVYSGRTTDVLKWFASLGYDERPGNPADVVLDLISVDFDKDAAIFGARTMRSLADVRRARMGVKI